MTREADVLEHPGAPVLSAGGSPSRISGKTRLVGLFGSPVSHSRSPTMHNTCFEAMGEDFAYIAFDVKEDDAAKAVQAIRLLNMRGANITMPIKRSVMPHLDQLTPAAELAGAVNVVVNDDGVLTGHVTDGEGFMLSLVEAGVDHIGKEMVILGAGAAAIAVAVQAALDGVRRITFFNRRDPFFDAAGTKISRLNERLECAFALHDLDDEDALREHLASANILVNGTPIGMKATIEQAALPDLNLLRPDLVVCDLVYVPEMTRLLKEAAARGCRIVSGMGMQLFQAAPAFEMWTGRKMDLDVARAALRSKADPQ